jgi:mannose-6-phosphate isomerase
MLIMEHSLYPLKFIPILKERLWGGTRLQTMLGKHNTVERCGESWELSGVEDDVSIVANGFLQGNSLHELVEIYMGDLTGDHVYEKFGNEFPLLVKFIDAQAALSIQVHPDDKLAAERHGAYGKTEMWYIMEAGSDSELIVGFNRPMDKNRYIQAVKAGKLKDIMNREQVAHGDVFYIPAGRIHAIGENILLAEIQQTSDVTYRVYDWNRVDASGNSRELHTELALDAIDYSYHSNYKTHYSKSSQGTAELVKCPYFTTNIINITQPLSRDYRNIDSFIIYICTAGACTLQWGISSASINIYKGDTILLPAVLDNTQLTPSEPAELLEVYIE